MTSQFDGPDTAVERSFDWSETVPSTAIAETVAEAVDERPTDIPPLYETIDTDALDAIIRDNGDEPWEYHPSISFTYVDLWVNVDGRGTVSVDPP